MWISAIILNFHHTFLQGAMHPCLIKAMCAFMSVFAYFYSFYACLQRVLS